MHRDDSFGYIPEVPITACLSSGSRVGAISMWSQQKFIEKRRNVHTNPLKGKLVADAKNWHWTSFLFYAGKDSSLLRTDPMNLFWSRVFKLKAAKS